ncbi:MAG: DUF4124 domain-containing protein [Betaproteobacteria bacterium]|nr:DUF4124 domain-containing protein [Betaproteobacteria bacterium]
MQPIRHLWLASLYLLAVTPALAQADVYKCVDAQGHVTYSNVTSKGCTKLSLDPVSTVPATPVNKGVVKTPTPGDFPRVSSEDQKGRDNDRRAILEEELDREQKNLEEAKRELAEQEGVRLGGERNYQRVLDRLEPYKNKVEQHQRNIDAIQKDIANLK